MADIDLGADRDPARFQISVDGVAGRQLHFHDHHRGREHRRHGRKDMPDGEIGPHLEGALGAHAGFDDVACIHGSWIRLKFVLTQAPSSSSFRGARSASPESILPVVVMDSGPAPSGASRNDKRSYFFCAAARSTKVLPPFILWANGASLIWITTASAPTPRFFTSAWVMSRIMPAFCSSVRPAAMLTVISGIPVSPFSFLSSWPDIVVCFRRLRKLVCAPAIHDLLYQTRRGCPAQGRA